MAEGSSGVAQRGAVPTRAGKTDTGSPAAGGPPASAALEEIRARLERARRKKNEAEQRLREQRRQQEQQQQQQQKGTPPEFPGSKPISSLPDTRAEKAQEASAAEVGGTPAPSSSSSNSAREARAALDRARSRLEGARKNRDRAIRMQQQQKLQQELRARRGPGPTSWNRSRWTGWNSNSSNNANPNANNTDAGNPLAPVSALATPLVISGISRLGPPRLVRHPFSRSGRNHAGHGVDNSNDRDNESQGSSSSSSSWSYMGGLANRERLVEILGGNDAIDALHRGEEAPEASPGEDSSGSSNESQENASGQTGKKAEEGGPRPSQSLAERKLQLQNELMALKEKLERKSSQLQQQQKQQQQQIRSDSHNDAANIRTEDHKNAKKTERSLTKQDLKKRKAEAQTVMDISYWKHFVSKQEHLLEQVTSKLQSMDENFYSFPKQTPEATRAGRAKTPEAAGGNAKGIATFQDCLRERHSTNVAIARVQEDLESLEARQHVVEGGISMAMANLLEARQALYQAKLSESQKAGDLPRRVVRANEAIKSEGTK